MGCSAIITDEYYVRNYDFSPSLYDGVFSLVQPESAFASAGYNLQMLGRHDGVNQHGLVLGLHFVSNNEFTKGVSAWTSVRMILDTCSTTEEAVQLLKEIPHSACYNFSIGDKAGNIAVVEASPDKVNIRRNSSMLSCVNHFQNQELLLKNRPFTNGSEKRNEYIFNFKDKQIGHEEMFENFKDSRSPLFFTDYDNLFGTLHTFSYSFKDSRILTAVARSNQSLDINFQDWVIGKNIKDEFLIGTIE